MSRRIKLTRWHRTPFENGDVYTDRPETWSGKTFSDADTFQEGYFITLEALREIRREVVLQFYEDMKLYRHGWSEEHRDEWIERYLVEEERNDNE